MPPRRKGGVEYQTEYVVMVYSVDETRDKCRKWPLQRDASGNLHYMVVRCISHQLLGGEPLN